MKKIGSWILRIIQNLNDEKVAQNIALEVKDFALRFPVP